MRRAVGSPPVLRRPEARLAVAGLFTAGWVLDVDHVVQLVRRAVRGMRVPILPIHRSTCAAQVNSRGTTITRQDSRKRVSGSSLGSEGLGERVLATQGECVSMLKCGIIRSAGAELVDSYENINGET